MGTRYSIKLGANEYSHEKEEGYVNVAFELFGAFWDILFCSTWSDSLLAFLVKAWIVPCAETIAMAYRAKAIGRCACCDVIGTPQETVNTRHPPSALAVGAVLPISTTDQQR